MLLKRDPCVTAESLINIRFLLFDFGLIFGVNLNTYHSDTYNLGLILTFSYKVELVN